MMDWQVGNMEEEREGREGWSFTNAVSFFYRLYAGSLFLCI